MPRRDDGAAPPVVCVVLAAGASRRLGRPKQLLPLRGRPLVRHILDATVTTAIDARAVVLGAYAGEVGAALAGSDAALLDNPGWDEGLASSIRVGIHWAESQNAGAAVFVLVDQPRLEGAHLERLVAEWRKGAVAVASAYESVRGVPALLDARLFHSLMMLRGDEGAAKVLRSLDGVALVPWPEGAIDIDTEADLAALR